MQSNRLHISESNPYLVHNSCVVLIVSLHIDHGKSHLQSPRVHDFLHGHGLGESPVGVSLHGQVVPEIVLLGSFVLAEKNYL